MPIYFEKAVAIGEMSVLGHTDWKGYTIGQQNAVSQSVSQSSVFIGMAPLLQSTEKQPQQLTAITFLFKCW